MLQPSSKPSYNSKFRYWVAFCELAELDLWTTSIERMGQYLAYLWEYTSLAPHTFIQYTEVVFSLLSTAGTFHPSPAEKRAVKRLAKKAANLGPNLRVKRSPLLPSQLFGSFDWRKAHALSFEAQVELLMLIVASYFGWRASSVFSLTVGDLTLNNTFLHVV
jgi:hypothetical protein